MLQSHSVTRPARSAMLLSISLAMSSLWAPQAGATPPPPPAPAADETHIVAYNQNPLSQYPNCQYGGEIVVQFSIGRYVGPVDGTGHLLNVASLINQGVVSPYATLRIPAGDIDYNTFPPGTGPYPNERDKVFFNGIDLGFLTGAQQIWEYNEFRIPVEALKFPSKGSDIVPPTPAINELRIQVDDTGHWCMSLDWVQLSFDAMAPVALVHGINSDQTLWVDFAAKFDQASIPFYQSINLTPNGAVATNSDKLADALNKAATSFGTKRLHLVAHSKGGLDAWYRLGRTGVPGVRILSVTSLSTPYRGSVIAQLSLISLLDQNGRFVSESQPLLTLLAAGLGGRAFLPERPGLEDLHPNRTPAILASARPPSSIRWASFGADADLNDNGRIEFGESSGLIPWFAVPVNQLTGLTTAMYQVLGTAAELSTQEVMLGTGGPGFWTEVQIAVPSASFQLNDLSVSTASARSPIGAFFAVREANHRSICSQVIASEVIARIRQDFPIE